MNGRFEDFREAELKAKVFGEWNQTEKIYPFDKTIFELFEDRVKQAPDTIAVICSASRLTYAELNAKSNVLARHIRLQYSIRTGSNLTPDTLIGLCISRGLEMVVAMLAIMKAGAAYVPLDPNYPQARVDYILNDTGTSLILCEKSLLEIGKINFPKDKILSTSFEEIIYDSADNSSNLPLCSGPENLAYVIYTSGTTGQPKGVMIEHKAAVNTLTALYNIYNPAEVKRTTAYTSYVFDVSVSEIFTSLLQGLELHILPDNTRNDISVLSSYLLSQEIDLAYLPPVLLGELPEQPYPNLKSLIYAGEPCNKRAAKRWTATPTKLYNYYGPTEASIYCTGKQIVDDEVEIIGKPIQNIKAFVLNDDMQAVGIGVTGELYIGGAGLARGYLNQPQLTQERFIPNPFASEADKRAGHTRLYKTGDLVRWLDDGNLEFFGRNDEQVKIRGGYRIELKEIEHALTQIKGIKQGCVALKIRKTSSEEIKYLVGYFVLQKGFSLSKDFLTNRLLQVLPDYMVPEAFVEIDSLPLTINGKLDKQSLPDPNFLSLDHYVAPTNELEEMLCKIWQEVLGCDRVGVTDNFFRIGGNSLLAIRASYRMSEVLKREVSVVDIFKYKSILTIKNKLLIHTDSKSSGEEWEIE